MFDMKMKLKKNAKKVITVSYWKKRDGFMYPAEYTDEKFLNEAAKDFNMTNEKLIDKIRKHEIGINHVTIQ